MSQKEKERKKKTKRKYGQAKLKHAKRGIFSCVISGLILFVLFVLLVTAYKTNGAAPSVVGGFAMVAFIFACISLYLGIRGFKEREKNYLTCKIGVTMASLLILGFIMIFCRGLF